MATFWRYNPEQSMATLYGPKMQRAGYAEGTRIGGPEMGAGRQALQQFKSYDDYLKAYRSDPTQYAGSSAVNYTNTGGGGIISAVRPTAQTSYNPFSQAQWQAAEEGRQIASGERLAAAGQAALSGLPDDVLNYANKFGGGSQLMDYYKQLLMDPQQMLNSPEYAFLKGEMEESVRRTNPRLSGARAIAAQERGGQLASTFRGQSLAERLAGAEQERLRGTTAQQTGMELARLKADLMMRPQEKIFETYWQTSGRNRAM